MPVAVAVGVDVAGAVGVAVAGVVGVAVGPVGAKTMTNCGWSLAASRELNLTASDDCDTKVKV